MYILESQEVKADLTFILKKNLLLITNYIRKTVIGQFTTHVSYENSFLNSIPHDSAINVDDAK